MTVKKKLLLDGRLRRSRLRLSLHLRGECREVLLLSGEAASASACRLLRERLLLRIEPVPLIAVSLRRSLSWSRDISARAHCLRSLALPMCLLEELLLLPLRGFVSARALKQGLRWTCTILGLCLTPSLRCSSRLRLET